MTRPKVRLGLAMLAWFAAALFLASCDRAPAGEPVVRVALDGGDAPAPGSQTDETRKTREIEPEVENACKTIEFDGARFTDCIADPKRHVIATALGPENGAPYRSFDRLRAGLGEKAASQVVFAVNAGMFDSQGRPIGYYVERSKRLQTLNRADGPGNFHMKPNGVFFGRGDEWRILTSDEFYATVGDRPEFGTQSGPMLLIKGKLHPMIAENGPSKAVRNAVGIDKRGRAHFVRSEGPVSFGQIARLFRDRLEVADALYLDGNVSALWNRATGRVDARAPLGPLIVVSRREKANAP